ncbi:MAG TPA: helix-turn-helix domain-containing protein [Pseudonocardia sp.]
MIETTRDAELATRFAESKLADEQSSQESKAARRAIVAELRERYSIREVAHLLSISETRVGQIMRSGR